MRAVCVYCGSRKGVQPAYAEGARRLGQLRAENGMTLVYGGGNVGLMGIIADTVMSLGGRVVGVIPRALLEKEVGRREVSELIVVEDMHERKLKMATLADAFIALPGGIGTLEELFETFTWLQLGFHTKPVALLDIGGYYRQLTGFLAHMVEQGFLHADQLDMLHVGEDPAALLAELATFEAPDTDHWFEQARLA
jgi:uncharacterized protein (TIGR00730 family)